MFQTLRFIQQFHCLPQVYLSVVQRECGTRNQDCSSGELWTIAREN